MKYVKVVIGIGAVVVVGLVLVVACYVGGRSAARSAAASIALGETLTALGPADPQYGQRLQHPQKDEILVHSAYEDVVFLSPTNLQFELILENTRDESIQLVPIGVEVVLTVRGWSVVGYGTGG